jgi:hypothetical protein
MQQIMLALPETAHACQHAWLLGLMAAGAATTCHASFCVDTA